MAPVIRDAYAEGYANQGGYRLARGDTLEAVRLFRKALVVQPEFPAVRILLASLPRAASR